MGNRVGLARTQALIQGLRRELALTSTTLNGVKIGMPDTVTADTTLTSADSNKVIRFDIASSDVTVTLPTTVTAGLTYTFLCVGASASTTKTTPTCGTITQILKVMVVCRPSNKCTPTATAAVSSSSPSQWL